MKDILVACSITDVGVLSAYFPFENADFCL